jgi:hypothetical protein
LKTAIAAIVVAGLFVVLAGCSGGLAGEPPQGDTLSSEARADYTLFTWRCSKCHSLSRPLNSGIDSDEYWQIYVAKMRRQPGSGISAEDSVAILRFLHRYSVEQRRKKDLKLGPPEPPPPEPDASAPMGAP